MVCVDQQLKNEAHLETTRDSIRWSIHCLLPLQRRGCTLTGMLAHATAHTVGWFLENTNPPTGKLHSLCVCFYARMATDAQAYLWFALIFSKQGFFFHLNAIFQELWVVFSLIHLLVKILETSGFLYKLIAPCVGFRYIIVWLCIISTRISLVFWIWFILPLIPPCTAVSPVHLFGRSAFIPQLTVPSSPSPPCSFCTARGATWASHKD